MRKNQMLKHLLRYFVSGAAICIGSVYAGELNFTASTASVAENTSTLTISVTRTGDASAVASVKVTSTAGTASSPGDFTAVDTTLNWAAGNSDSKTVDITIVDNNTVNTDKTFTLGLSAVTGDTIGATSTLTATITDFEEGVLQFNGAIFQASEDVKVAKLKVTRTNGSNGAVGATVSFTDVSAVKGADYFGADKTVTLANGVSEATLEVTLKDDSIGEATESFTATLASPTGGATLGEQATATVEIFDTDADFTTSANKLSFSVPNVTQPDVIDLNQASLLDASQTYLELINAIPLLSTSKLSLSQSSVGLVEIPFGNDKFYLRPTRVSRNALNLDVGVRTTGSSLYRFITQNNIVIEMHPAVASIGSLQSALASLSMPELTVTEKGNITIQKDQGVPKIEKNENGELVLSDSFYERWHVRAMAIVTRSPYNVTGIYQQNHPTAAGQGIVALYFLDGSDYRVQYLHSSPADDQELEVAMRQSTGITDVEFLEYGLVKIKKLESTGSGWSTNTVTLISDYTLFKRQAEPIGIKGFSEAGDINGDGLQDYMMIYQSNDRQYFFTVRQE